MSIYRDAIITLAARYKLPAVYAFRLNAVDGGLLPMDQIGSTSLGVLTNMLIAFLKVKSPLICPYRLRTSTNSLSTSRLPRRSVSTYQHRFWLAPMR